MNLLTLIVLLPLVGFLVNGLAGPRLGKGVVAASETCALDLVGATFIRELQPGEFVRISDGVVEDLQPLRPRPGSRCDFELIYFARPDTPSFGQTGARGDAGAGQKMGFASTSADLSRALRRNVHLKVLAASGRYDLGTPYSASDWSLAQLDAPPEVLARVQHRYYDAGHMMYTRQADLAQLKQDLAAWLG